MIVKITTPPGLPARYDNVEIVTDMRGKRWFKGIMYDNFVFEFPHRSESVVYQQVAYRGPIYGPGVDP